MQKTWTETQLLSMKMAMDQKNMAKMIIMQKIKRPWINNISCCQIC